MVGQSRSGAGKLAQNAIGFVKQDQVVLHGCRGMKKDLDCPENTKGCLLVIWQSFTHTLHYAVILVPSIKPS
jgi:hypothetical protein|tara:strand:+ start:862 stop:1077 length:216 start_codon:yes stop_codon:yes gene_type:complete